MVIFDILASHHAMARWHAQRLEQRPAELDALRAAREELEARLAAAQRAGPSGKEQPRVMGGPQAGSAERAAGGPAAERAGPSGKEELGEGGWSNGGPVEGPIADTSEQSGREEGAHARGPMELAAASYATLSERGQPHGTGALHGGPVAGAPAGGTGPSALDQSQEGAADQVGSARASSRAEDGAASDLHPAGGCGEAQGVGSAKKFRSIAPDARLAAADNVEDAGASGGAVERLPNGNAGAPMQGRTPAAAAAAGGAELGAENHAHSSSKTRPAAEHALGGVPHAAGAAQKSNPAPAAPGAAPQEQGLAGAETPEAGVFDERAGGDLPSGRSAAQHAHANGAASHGCAPGQVFGGWPHDDLGAPSRDSSRGAPGGEDPRGAPPAGAQPSGSEMAGSTASSGSTPNLVAAPDLAAAPGSMPAEAAAVESTEVIALGGELAALAEKEREEACPDPMVCLIL